MLQVKKRNGELEPLDLEKLHKMTIDACDGLTGVSASQVEMQSDFQFFDGIATSDIQKILVKSAADLITLDNPNYQYVAARLLLYGLRKEVFGQFDYIPLKDLIKKNIKLGVYDGEILNIYTNRELDKLDSYMKHDRDLDFTYAGIQQVVDKYLVQDRSSGTVFETPQYMYMLIAMWMFSKYPKETRLDYIKRYYNAISSFKINIPTPIMAGVRTPIRQYASCVLVDSDDTLHSIFSSDMAIGYYTAQRAGIGVNASRIRGINSKIRGGEVQHTGVIPFLKKFEATVRSCTQNGVRGGSATVFFPIWHQEIENILVLKNNKGTEDNRVRKLDYGIQLSKLFYERYQKNKDISLFSPHDVPGLYRSFGHDNFDKMYAKYEKDDKIPRKTIKARELIDTLLKERLETGRIYIMNIDHSNSHSSFTDPIFQSNLCMEITLPTKPIQHIDDENGEIALCILSALNVGKITKLDDLEELCDLAVRGLDELIDFQSYPVKAAELSTKNRRSLGIGYIGLAYYLAKNKVKYDSPEAWKLVHDLSEAFQFYLLKASNELAKEKGKCEYFNRTKYSNGVLPIDTYKKEVDEVVPNVLKYNWEELRASIKEFGLRNSTLSAQMPSESSSVVCNTTNGIEPPRDFLSLKKSKKTPLKQIVPGYYHYRNYYTLLWDMPNNNGYFKIVAVMQKFFDQAISSNWSYNPEHYPQNKIPSSVLLTDLFTCYKLGHKTAYYCNVYDQKTDEVEETLPISEEIIEDEDCESCKI